MLVAKEGLFTGEARAGEGPRPEPLAGATVEVVEVEGGGRRQDWVGSTGGLVGATVSLPGLQLNSHRNSVGSKRGCREQGRQVTAPLRGLGTERCKHSTFITCSVERAPQPRMGLSQPAASLCTSTEMSSTSHRLGKFYWLRPHICGPWGCSHLPGQS